MIRVILFALALLLPGVAHAQRLALHSGDVGGMVVPSYNGSIACSPKCIGGSVDMVVPTMSATGSGVGSTMFLWAGLNGTGGITSNAICTGGPGPSGTCDCTTGCLWQFGIQVTGTNLTTTPTFVYQGWWEVFPSVANRQLVSFVPLAGDIIRMVPQCTTNCTNAAASQTFSVIMYDIRNGVVISSIDLSSHFNLFSLGFDKFEAGVEERDANMVFASSLHWSGFKTNQSGCTTGCTTSGLAPVALTQTNITFHTSGSGATQTYSVASGSYGTTNSDFNTCMAVTTTPLTLACAATPTSGAGTFGENLHRLLTKRRMFAAAAEGP